METMGERLRVARRSAGLSLRELARRVGVSAQAISKYERGLDVPSTGVLVRLAAALDTSAEYFLRPRPLIRLRRAHPRCARLHRKQERAILSRIQEWLERYTEVESLLHLEKRFELPATLNRQVTSLEDVERVALDLRGLWALGFDAVHNLVEVLEDQGIRVGLVDACDEFDACTFWADDGTPVIAVNKQRPGDRQRFSMAHELGHLILEPVRDLDPEKAAQRFAGAFLIPEPTVRRELGQVRRTLSPYELHMLKHKYGASIQAWIGRARDLRILSQSGLRALHRQFSRIGWRRQEPGDQIAPEEPRRLARLVMRAVADDLVSPTRASELLGEPLGAFLRREARLHGLFLESVHQ